MTRQEALTEIDGMSAEDLKTIATAALLAALEANSTLGSPAPNLPRLGELQATVRALVGGGENIEA